MNNTRQTKMLHLSPMNLVSLRTTVYTPILVVCLTLLVSACSSSSKRSPVSSSDVLTSERKNATTLESSNSGSQELQKLQDSLALEKPGKDAGANNIQARSYLNKAKNRSIQEQPAFLLSAAEFFFAANNPRDAIAALDKIEATALSDQERAQYTILRAKSLGFSQRYSDSLSLLEQVNQEHLYSNKYRAEYYSVKAQGEFSVGNKAESMIALLNRENFLERNEIIENQQRLWEIIDLSTEAELAQIRQTTENQALADWLDLTTLVNQARSLENPAISQETYNLDSSVADPNNTVTTNITSAWTSNSPQKIALLLPISSTFGAAAKAFEAGFRQASRDNNTPFRPNVATYDLGDASQTFNYINQATQDNADFIVGPLGKAAAQSVLDVSNPSIPVMTLGGVINRPSPLLSVFTLSPEQEMAAIARHALSRGFSKATILYPNSAWGERNREAFKQVWSTTVNGTIVSEQVYQAESYDHSETIKTLLSINASTARHNTLSATIGFKPNFTPTRRSDIDFLVLIARNNVARVVKPQLSFHQAHDLPIYSTSAVYNGVVDPANDADLDGLTFPEMPWLLSDINNSNASDSRLFAFGYDTYQLIPILTQLRLSDGLSYQGLSGRLSANSNGQIVRHPAFATFKNGIPEIEESSQGGSPRYEVDTPTPSVNNTEPVINRSNRYDSKNWDAGASRRK